MKAYTLGTDNDIMVFASPEEAHANRPFGAMIFTNQEQLDKLATDFDAARLLEIYNFMPGEPELKKFDRKSAATKRIFECCQRLTLAGETKEEPTPGEGAEVTEEATGVKKKKKVTKSATPKDKKPKAVKAPKAAKTPKVRTKKEKAAKGTPKPRKAKGEPKAPNGDSKTALLVGLLKRKDGATLPELMEATNWQAHSVRGAISTLSSKHGVKVESTKENGVRSYRIAE